MKLKLWFWTIILIRIDSYLAQHSRPLHQNGPDPPSEHYQPRQDNHQTPTVEMKIDSTSQIILIIPEKDDEDQTPLLL